MSALAALTRALRDHALRYLDASLSPVPALLPTKKAAVEWKSLQTTPATAETVRAWFGRPDPKRLLAVVCGAVSRNLELIDFDAAAEATFETWCALVERYCPGLVKRLYLERTPRGGRHAAYRCASAVEGNRKLAQRPRADEPTRPEVLIETRGEGGYAAVAPSPGYVALQGDLTQLPTITADERSILLACAMACNQWVDERAMVRGPARERHQTQPEVGDGDTRPGDAYNAAATNDTMLDLLTGSGWTVARQLSNHVQLTRPGKDKRDGLSATLGYVAPGVLYVFSSNASPFEPGRAYSAFAVYALLKHDGNFKQAAGALAEQGFGTPRPRPTLRLVSTDETPATTAPVELDASLPLTEQVAVLVGRVRQAELAILRLTAERDELGGRLDRVSKVIANAHLTPAERCAGIAIALHYQANPHPPARDGAKPAWAGDLVKASGLTIATERKNRARLEKLGFCTTITEHMEPAPGDTHPKSRIHLRLDVPMVAGTCALDSALVALAELKPEGRRRPGGYQGPYCPTCGADGGVEVVTLHRCAHCHAPIGDPVTTTIMKPSPELGPYRLPPESPNASAAHNERPSPDGDSVAHNERFPQQPLPLFAPLPPPLGETGSRPSCAAAAGVDERPPAAAEVPLIMSDRGADPDPAAIPAPVLPFRPRRPIEACGHCGISLDAIESRALPGPDGRVLYRVCLVCAEKPPPTTHRHLFDPTLPLAGTTDAAGPPGPAPATNGAGGVEKADDADG